MTTTLSYPADAVTNGASVIQAKTFINISADYQQITWGNAQANAAKIGKLGAKLMSFPRSPVEDSSWVFFMRKDMANSAASNRNMIGLHVTNDTAGINAFSGALGTQIAVPFSFVRVEVFNWHPQTMTLTDGTAATRFLLTTASICLAVDPESGGFLYGDGSFINMTETLGFIFTPVAANYPTLTPALNAATGVNPLG